LGEGAVNERKKQRGSDSSRRWPGLTEVRGRARQRRYPPEFRIPRVRPPQDPYDRADDYPPPHDPYEQADAYPPPQDTSARPETRTGPAAPAVPRPPTPRRAAAEEAGTPSDASLVDLATSLWRLGKKLAESAESAESAGSADSADSAGSSSESNGPGPGRASAAARRKETRHLTAALDALAAAGVRAQDHDGTDFDLGLALEVLAYQPLPHATRETVHETLRPSVFRDGRRIQMGQVIVARPEGDQDHDA
jgi:hypothetical protein